MKELSKTIAAGMALGHLPVIQRAVWAARRQEEKEAREAALTKCADHFNLDESDLPLLLKAKPAGDHKPRRNHRRKSSREI